jgi:hypothetical protein
MKWLKQTCLINEQIKIHVAKRGLEQDVHAGSGHQPHLHSDILGDHLNLQLRWKASINFTGRIGRF